ncbi:unnamed protein product [Rhizophagus irregularis]|uniref:Uncharacterized protein n=1 Tax=Rhizophagus irregularis TaxID=588596 RepID=A0A2I1H7Q0_9GLOM|nr:hypothetical protein RhiirA4_473961 [Rhizophagus irregularis]CAB4428410.1 unnamed protein product [Rhizophagus irregularis]
MKISKTRLFRNVNVYQKIRIDSGGKRIKKKPPKHCQNCKETNDCVKLFLNKTNRLEGIVGNFRKNLPMKTNKISIFRAKFTLNSVPCELEYDLSRFTLENLQKLADFTTQNCNNKKDNIPCELEYDLSRFTLENLQKLADFTTQNYNTTIKIIVLLAKRINIFRIIKFKK